MNGWLNIFDRCKQVGLNFIYTSECIDFASKNGDIHMLNWWKKASTKCSIELKYTTDAMDHCAENGSALVLEWWLKSGFMLKYTSHIIDYASINGHLLVLNWWLRNRKIVHLKYTIAAVKKTSVPDWWKESGLYMFTDNEIIEN